MATQACSSGFHLQSNNPSEFYTDLTIWLHLIPICKEAVDVFLLTYTIISYLLH